jgi:hypothetical protein
MSVSAGYLLRTWVVRLFAALPREDSLSKVITGTNRTSLAVAIARAAGHLSVFFFFAASFNPADAASPSGPDDQLFTYNFSAGANYFAFMRQGGDKQVLVIYDSSAKRLSAIRARSGNLWWLSAKASGGALYVGQTDGITPDQLRAGGHLRATLYRCLAENSSCASVFDFDQSIQNVLDLDNGDLLFISGKSEVMTRGLFPSREFVAPRKFDFFLRRNDGEIRRLTSWEASKLTSATVAHETLVFEMLPGQVVRRNGPPPTSDIYSIVLTKERQVIEVPTDGSPRFIAYGKHLDLYPFISPDGRKTALLSSSSYEGNQWRYDIVIVENSSKKALHTITPDPGTRLSRPVFVDADKIQYLSFDGTYYVFRQFDTAMGQETEVGRISLTQLNATPLQELTNTAGAR